MSSQQIHKKFSDEQVIAILENYLAKEISAKEAMAKLEIKRSQFFNLASRYRNGSEKFTIKHKGNDGNRKISAEVETAILEELKKEKKLIDNKNMPIESYNYSAVRDDLKSKLEIEVALSTIISRAKDNGYYLARRERKIHDREVITNLAGELAQHDSSFHQWSPICLRSSI
jgi:transposase